MRGVKVRTNFVYPSSPPHSVTDNLIPPFHYKKSSQSSMKDILNRSFASPPPHVVPKPQLNTDVICRAKRSISFRTGKLVRLNRGGPAQIIAFRRWRGRDKGEGEADDVGDEDRERRKEQRERNVHKERGRSRKSEEEEEERRREEEEGGEGLEGAQLLELEAEAEAGGGGTIGRRRRAVSCDGGRRRRTSCELRRALLSSPLFFSLSPPLPLYQATDSGFEIPKLLKKKKRRRSGLEEWIAPAPQSGNFHSFDENWLLKRKGEEVASYLNGRCIFLVGMMGSGKTTVGKILSEALAYSFVDSDKYVEESLGGSTVAQIFKKFGESFFRDYESEALRNLSLMPRQVVATGGGVVIRPINWEHMKEGVTVYLDVPLDALARRIAAVGTGSRPLLDFDSGDAYTKSEALRNLSLMPRQVVATGGGVVIRPINWEHMKEGVTVYLDVPLDALARRIAAVGTGSRPLLDFDSGDAYTKAFMGLFTLSKKRGHAYASADATVSLQYIAADLGLDISDITPTAIALEVLVQIENFLQRNNGMSIKMFP
ncbi:hypothetical protein TEA_013388 [Camellia sinensis var. sinensis]|uniref:shikimate kinase n=1 Tax=Camellia sinensis var. sinensis TaxID=542762 RepID=A0A4S4D5Z1_CAMSN|nr:hypothetical protein TEA_013388 [Camellia sinensis var. sinensis]